MPDNTQPQSAQPQDTQDNMPENLTNINMDTPDPEVSEDGAADPELAEFLDPVARIAQLEAQLAEREDNWLRARAEADNARRRAQEEVSKAHKFAVEKFAGELLTVRDSLEAALSSDRQSVEDLRGGVELTLKQLSAAFEKSAIREINPAGEKFDPHQHQAMGMIEADQEPNTVALVLQKGYLIAERVLRPALVMVVKAKEA